MDFRQLETLVAVVETGSFTRAGERLFLTQPTITAHINILDQELGSQLLVRSTKGIQPTEAGRRCYDYAKRTLSDRTRLLQELGGDGAQRLRLVSSTVPAHCLLPQLMADYRALHPEIVFQLTMCDSTEVSLHLQKHQADLGFCGATLEDAECRYQPLVRDELVVVTPPTERFRRLGKGPFPLSQLSESPLLCREAGSGTRLSFERWLHAQGLHIKPEVAAEMDDPQVIKNAVAAGVGIAVLSSRTVEDLLALGKVLVFPLENAPQRDLYIVRRKRGSLLGSVGTFYDFVLERFQPQPEGKTEAAQENISEKPAGPETRK